MSDHTLVFTQEYQAPKKNNKSFFDGVHKWNILIINLRIFLMYQFFLSLLLLGLYGYFKIYEGGHSFLFFILFYVGLFPSLLQPLLLLVWSITRHIFKKNDTFYYFISFLVMLALSGGLYYLAGNWLIWHRAI